METQEEAATGNSSPTPEAELPVAGAASGTTESDVPVYFEVVLKGGAPWGFSLKGGSEQRCPISIAKITAGGKASLSGQLQCDDQILAVNEVQCDSHEEAIQLVKSAFNTLHLSLIRGSPNEYKHGMKTPEYYHSSAQIYSKDMHPHHGHDAIEPTKTSPATGGINRRLKKRDSTNSRPKSWHNAETSQHWKEREFQQQQQLQRPQTLMQQVPRPMPQGYGYPVPHGLNPAPSMDSLMMQGGAYPTKMLRGPNTQSMMSLHYQEKLEYSPEYMKKTMPEFRSSQDMNYYTKEREFATSYYGDKRAPFVSVNPAFRRVDLSPAETYPKVAVATQLQSAQQRAFIGRVPDSSEEPQEKHVQTFTSSRTVSYSTVQMPQKQYASTADFQPQYNNNNNPPAVQQQQFPGFIPSVYSPTSPTHSSSYSSGPISPTEKKTPPPLPVRGESRNRTLQISEHMKSSSWPATTESVDTYNSEKPDSVISPADIPPVKLSPSQEYPPPPRKSSSSSGSISSIPMESNYYHDDVSGPKSPGVYTAKPYFIEDTATDINPWFSNEQKEKDHNSKYSYKDITNPPSPPTRDIDPQRTVSGKGVRRERRPTADSLTGAYQSYLEEMLDQEEHFKGADPIPSTPSTPSPDPLSQTAPSQYNPRMQPINEDRISRTMALPQEASVPSTTNRWTEERNKKNHLMGQMDERTWQSPADYKGKDVIEQTAKPPEVHPQPVDPKEEEWQRIVKTAADSQWDQRKTDETKKHAHIRELSELDEKSLSNNAPRIRSPINKTLVEAIGSKEDISGKSFSRMLEENNSNVKKESRDVRNSGSFALDGDNPFRNSGSNDNKPKPMAETFSSEDWKKMNEIDSGNSIMSMLRNSHQTPFSSKYVNGEPVLTKEQKQSRDDSKPPELPPRSQPVGVPPQLPPRPSTGHVRAESFDLDLRTNSSKASYPAKRSDVPSDSNGSNNSTINHTRAHSFTGCFPPSPYGTPNDPRCTSIPEEQGSDSSDVPPPLPPRNVDRDRRSISSSDNSGSRSVVGSTEELSKVRNDRSERRTSDPRVPEAVRRQRISDPRDPRSYWAQHQYSKSDSEKYQRASSAHDSWHKMSDPSGAIRKQHKVSDPDEKRKVQEALRKFYHEKTSSQDSGICSRPNSICEFDHYSSMSSIPSSRPGSVPADQLSPHHRVFTSQTSLSSTSSICRDSGISSPTNWAMHSPPQMTNIPSPEYDRHHPSSRHSTSSLGDNRHSQSSEPRSYDHRNPPWLSNELQQGRKSSPVVRSSSMSVKPGRRDERDYSRKSYEGNIGLSRTDSFTAYKTRPDSVESYRARSGSDSRQDKRRRSRDERKLREEQHNRSLLKEEHVEGTSPKRKWTPPKQSPLVIMDQSQPPLSEIHAQVQQAERKTLNKVGETAPDLDEEDEELVQVEEQRVIAQKASQQQASLESLRKKEDPPPVFRFPSPPINHPQNQRSKVSPGSPRKEPLSLPSPPVSPPSTQISRTSSPQETQQYSLQPPQKKPLCQVDSFVLPPPPSPAHDGAIYIDHDMDFPPPPPEVLEDTSQLSPTEGRLSQTLPVELEGKGLIDESVCWNRDWKRTHEKLVTSPTSDVNKSIDTTPQSTVVEADHQREEPLAPCALQEDSDIDSDTVEGLSQDSVEIGESSTTPRRTQVVSPIFPDDVSEPQNEVQVIERPTELPLMTPSPRRPSEGDDLNDSNPRSPVLSPKDTVASSDSGIGIIDFVIKSLTPCGSSDLIDLFPESERKAVKKMPHSGEDSSVVTPKRSDVVEGPPTPSVIPSSLYLQLSPGKALLLTRAKGMQGTGKDEIGEDNAELRKTKEELIIRITRKVEELRSLHIEVQEEITSVEKIGKKVSEKAKECCKASEFNKYTMYVEDVDRVTKLLLSLSRRLAKVDSVLSSLDNQDKEQNADLQTMKQNLERKYNDAKMLKSSIDMRHKNISKMLLKYLNEEEHSDFCHFIRESPRQHIMAQELDDKIQLGEEQLQALTDSLRKADSNES